MMDLKQNKLFGLNNYLSLKKNIGFPGHLDVLEFDMNGGCFDIVDGIKTDLSEEDLLIFTIV